MQIRPAASVEEIERAHALFERAWPGQRRRTPRGAVFYRSRFPAEASLMVVAESDGEIVGAVFGFCEEHSVTIGEVAVDEAFRRRDLGSSLLAMLETGARMLGKEALVLGAADEAVEFYLANGFTARLFVQVFGDDREERLKRLLTTELALREVMWRGDDPAAVRLIVATEGPDFDLKKRIDALPEHSAQILMMKPLE